MSLIDFYNYKTTWNVTESGFTIEIIFINYSIRTKNFSNYIFRRENLKFTGNIFGPSTRLTLVYQIIFFNHENFANGSNSWGEASKAKNYWINICKCEICHKPEMWSSDINRSYYTRNLESEIVMIIV